MKERRHSTAATSRRRRGSGDSTQGGASGSVNRQQEVTSKITTTRSTRRRTQNVTRESAAQPTMTSFASPESNSKETTGVEDDHKHQRRSNRKRAELSDEKDQKPALTPQKREIAEYSPLVILEAGKPSETKIKIMLGGCTFVPGSPSDDSATAEYLGNDGNQYFCEACQSFGDVVCCDGCPKVYHRSCLSEGTPARVSLENDEEPWYCPYCLQDASGEQSNVEKSDKKESEIAADPSVNPQDSSTDEKHKLSAEEEEEAEVGGEIPEADTVSAESGKYEEDQDTTGVEEEVQQKDPHPLLIEDEVEDLYYDNGVGLGHVSSDGTYVRAVPAFCFYLMENRSKIERNLARKHRYFNRLPKGESRNGIVAKAAASWWMKLRNTDHRRFMNMSMRDFETRIMEFKENKKQFQDGDEDTEEADDITPDEKDNDDQRDSSHEVPSEASDKEAIEVEDSHAQRRIERHKRRLESVFVGGKRLKLEADQSYNRVFLDLLHDIRFSPDPMLFPRRDSPRRQLQEDVSRNGVPYFDVDGPISTSIGDECIGCTRGWKHYCAVLKCMQPSVEFRSRLQPPLSSLMATRVGIGLRPKLMRPADGDLPSMAHTTTAFDEAEKMKNLTIVPSGSLRNASARMDELVQVIEETTAMSENEPSKGESEGNDDWFKCGRCRTVTKSSLGCTQCRRAQLVINRTKLTDVDEVGEACLKVRTIMLKSYQGRDDTYNDQALGDKAVAKAILKERWTPLQVLPSSGMKPEDPNYLDGSHEDLSMTLIHKSGRDGESSLSPVFSDSQSLENAVGSSRRGGDRSKSKPNEVVRMQCIGIGCHGIFLAITRRDPSRLLSSFKPTGKAVDLLSIKQRVLSDSFESFEGLKDEIECLCDTLVNSNTLNSIQTHCVIDIKKTLHESVARATGWLSTIDAALGKLATGSSLSETIARLGKLEPQAMEVFEHGDELRQKLARDLMRTRENEIAYYGSQAIRRATKAATSSLAPHADCKNEFNVVMRRDHNLDGKLRARVDRSVAAQEEPVSLATVTPQREESLVRFLRKVQAKRTEASLAAESTCSRCVELNENQSTTLHDDIFHAENRIRLSGCVESRMHQSREHLCAGLGSQNTKNEVKADKGLLSSVRTSSIHGMGLFADQAFEEGMKVLEYEGDILTVVEAEERERAYRSRRFNHFIFHLDDSKAVDATMEGSQARFINHHCNSNCTTELMDIDGKKVVVIRARKDIPANTEISIDYRLPIVSELSKRIPCTCQAEDCKGFLVSKCLIAVEKGAISHRIKNWPFPEPGSSCKALLVAKRGANMRDRIRRLRRPLKRNEWSIQAQPS